MDHWGWNKCFLVTSWTAVSLLSVGCAADSPSGGRGALSKGELTGSCSIDSCDGPSLDGNCWCDVECSRPEFDDCCSNRVEVCEERPCREPGDCRGDMTCQFTIAAQCGDAAPGVCRTPPDVVHRDAAPVCGCDGSTYINEEAAWANGTSAAAEGPCPSADRLCLSSESCHSGEACDDSVCLRAPCTRGHLCNEACFGRCITPRICGDDECVADGQPRDASCECVVDICEASPECCTAWSEQCVRDAIVFCGIDCL